MVKLIKIFDKLLFKHTLHMHLKILNKLAIIYNYKYRGVYLQKTRISMVKFLYLTISEITSSNQKKFDISISHE